MSNEALLAVLGVVVLVAPELCRIIQALCDKE